MTTYLIVLAAALFFMGLTTGMHVPVSIPQLCAATGTAFVAGVLSLARQK